VTEFEALYIYLSIYGFPVLFVAVIAIISAWVIWEFRITPLEARRIRTASRKKRTLFELAGDDGYVDFHFAHRSGSEGSVETKKRGKTKEYWAGFLPQQRKYVIDEEKVIVASDKDRKKTIAIAHFLNRLASRKLFLRHARIPVWIGYRGKAVLTSIISLAGLEILVELQSLFPEEFATIDIVALKTLFPNSWNESQVTAHATDSERIGALETKKLLGRESWLWPIVLVGFALGMGVLLLAMMYMFG